MFKRGVRIEGLKDSKKLSPLQRQKLLGEICKKALCFSVIAKDNFIIDEINILNATLLAMKCAIESLKVKPDLCIVDGNRKVKNLFIEQETIVKGDNFSAAIAAASVLAKEERDKIMRSYAKDFPNYCFDKHKGYATAQHVKALGQFGPCPIHRKTFAPVREASKFGKLENRRLLCHKQDV
ncbi:MAG: ribonuclease HII [Elusimicrobiota bacterium]|nr:ribonuclease HII [Elusimicrobiota bacterium]